MSRIRPRLDFLVALGLATVLQSAHAREPGIAPVTPPGLTLGLPIATSLPKGLYWTQRVSYYESRLNDAHGNYGGSQSGVFAMSSQITYVPGLTVLGATYKALAIVPFVDQSLARTTTATGPLGTYQHTDMANPKFEPISLTWKLGHGCNVGAGVGIYVPLGQYTTGNAINLGANFFTVEPSLGLTCLTRGWNTSWHLVYDTNTRNVKLKYKSGDQVLLNATLTRKTGRFIVGPVAYGQRQVTPDSNEGGRASFGGRTFASPYSLAFGLLGGHSLGPSSIVAYVTRDVRWSNTIGGTKGWLGVTFKLV